MAVQRELLWTGQSPHASAWMTCRAGWLRPRRGPAGLGHRAALTWIEVTLPASSRRPSSPRNASQGAWLEELPPTHAWLCSLSRRRAAAPNTAAGVTTGLAGPRPISKMRQIAGEPGSAGAGCPGASSRGISS